MKAVKKVFPKILIKGCYYHFNMPVPEGQMVEYLMNSEKKTCFQMCWTGTGTLAERINTERIPVDYVKEPFWRRYNKILYKYFKKQWLVKTEFPKLSCCEKENIRTTNNKGDTTESTATQGRQWLTCQIDTLMKETKHQNIFQNNTKKSKNNLEVDEKP